MPQASDSHTASQAAAPTAVSGAAEPNQKPQASKEREEQRQKQQEAQLEQQLKIEQRMKAQDSEQQMKNQIEPSNDKDSDSTTTLNTTSSSPTTTTTPTSTSNTTTTGANENHTHNASALADPTGSANGAASSSVPAGSNNQQDGQAEPPKAEPVKQFSEKSLQELADHYLTLAPADIPDSGFVVSGIAGRFPSADNLNELWDNLFHNRDMVIGPDDKRWPLGLWDLPKKAARIKDISRFDNEFFGYPKEQADYTDHQLRNLYEVVYESMLDAGMNPAKVRGDKRMGIFFGFHTNETDNEFMEKPHFKTTGYQSQLLTAITDYFDLRGVAGSFDAACASSFAAFHQAVVNLRLGLIDTAIVCGVNISVRPGTAFQFLLLQMLSPTGSSKFLDASADGYAKTEACVSVILTRKDVAKRSYAAIVHTKCNNDGFKVEGITFPSSKVQEALMNDAIVEAGVDPKQIVYVEAHGTGTPAGDPEEARAIAKVYCENRDQPLLIGSVKSNLGHAEGVSGLCSLAKVICTFENELLPSNLHYKTPNPNIQPLVEGRLKPVDKNIPFKHNLIPMNCYGFGGVNVHGIFKTHTRAINKETDYDIAPEFPRLITLFGRSQAAIEYAFNELKTRRDLNGRRLLTRDYLALLDSISDGPIDRLMNYRGFMLLDNELNEVASSIVEMSDHSVPLGSNPREQIALKNDKLESLDRLPHYQDFERSLWFILPGLGCQWKAMAHNLTKFKPVWTRIENLARTLAPFGVDLIEVLTSKEKNVFEDSVVNLFTGIVAVQIALIDLMRLLEVKPEGIVGHSIGEISCAYADGLLNANETILLAYYLAKPIDDAKFHKGAMAAASLSKRQAEQYIEQFVQRQRAKKGSNYGGSSIEIGCINGDESITVSGESQEIDEFIDMLTEENAYARRIADVKTPFHNSSLRCIEKEMMASVQKLFNNNQVNQKEGQFQSKNWYSTLYSQDSKESNQVSSGKRPQQFEISARYYVDNLCSPVQFKDAINQLEAKNSIVLEIGPHSLFLPILKQKYLTKLNHVSLMKRMDGSVESLLTGLGQLYQMGQPLKIAKLYPEVQWPVAKGTGSISSIIRWNHQHQFHVAKYPEAFRRPPCEARVRFDLIDETDKYLAGHCVDGRVLFPATGYLYLVWRSFSMIKDKIGDSPIRGTGETQLVPVEFHDVRLHRATILGSAPIELMVRIEEATGQFEVREGGSIVADGTICPPKVNPDGMQYDHIRENEVYKNTEMSLNADDVYKQFRVCGYDYGESFRNIVAASHDGLHSHVKWSGQFIPFSDSVLQSLFLVICKKTSALFLPTKFEYMRINPKLLQDKIDAAQAENRPCILDAYCEPETGIIITDGIEMRGVGASPAPRRNQQDPVLESYQFVPNCERNIQDLLAEAMNLKVEQYMEMCSTAAYKILSNLQQSRSQIVNVMNGFKQVDDAKLNAYLDENEQSDNHILLRILDKILESQEEPPEKEVVRGGMEAEEAEASETDNNNKGAEGEQTSDKPAAPAKTGPSRERKPNPKLKCIQDLQKQFERVVKNEFEALQAKLGGDLISSAFVRERFLRPLLEIVFENTPSQKVKLLELNPGNGIKYEHLANIVGEILPNLSINYFLAHPDTKSIPNDQLPNDTKLYNWTPASRTLQRELQDIDLVMYTDSSCYPTRKNQFVSERVKTEEEVAKSEPGSEEAKVELFEDVASVFTSAYETLRANGFLLAFVRSQLSPAEKFLYKVADFEVKQREDRLDLMLEAAKRAKFHLVAEKSDKTGCFLMLFRKFDDKIQVTEQKLLHIQYGQYGVWLEALKHLLNDVKEKSSSETINKNIWLIANDSNQHGILGMVNCLRKEPGGERLRFLFDQRKVSPLEFTCQEIEFERIIKPEKEGDEERKELVKSNAFIDIKSVEQDPTLVNLIKQDLTYNCIDQDGHYGSYRHFTISELLENQKVKTDEAHINIGTRGDLSSFKWFQSPYKYVEQEKKNKDRISIYYSSLNFRDIMLASGRLPLDALPLKLALSDCILGLEFSGRKNDGTRVAGMVGGRGIATTFIYDDNESIMIKIPDNVSLEEAASVPVVYGTALMALVFRGKMQKGETILIHSGSGGVGQAAIRLCIYYGLTVYTTVGNQEKRDFLKEEFPQLTDAHIFNSRDCSFETEIMKATNGRGVDLVLNSLSEEKLIASVRCLADGGRFLEIGKYDMAMNNAVELLLLDTNKTFHGVLLDKLFDSDYMTPIFIKQRWDLVDELERGFENGSIKPIKRTIFDKDQVEDAFRFMASGKHIGKVSIRIREEEIIRDSDDQVRYQDVAPYPVIIEAQPQTMFDPKKSYIITGGLGGFGLELAKWMSANGSKNLVLTSRTGIKTGYHQLVVDRLRLSGTNVIISNTDTIKDEGAEQLIAEANSLAPIGGIFNLAMVLRDGLFENTTEEAFQQVCAPKCLAVAALDRVTRRLCPEMDLFIAFSSVSCGKGNAGQANYGYANSVMERICENRRRDGHHGLAIQWGAIGDVGVAFDNLGGNEAIIGGTIPQRMPSCFSTLSKLITSPFSVCLSILQADRRSFGAGKKGDLVKTILHVLGIKDPSSVDPNCTLGELGLDSLMAVEIRQALEREYDIVLTVQEIRALTINRIREIGEGGTKKAASNDQQEAGLVSATDELGLSAAQQQRIYETESGVKLSAVVPGLTVTTSAAGQRVFVVDKAQASRTSLELPSEDLILLNGDTGIMLSGNPIFCLPPIQGDFSRLSAVVKKMSRPCIGLCWTGRMARFTRIDEAIEEHVKVIREYYPQLKTLDLIGYSFGAAVAFEIMAHIQKNKFPSMLNSGKLILLDGSPDQITIGVRYITNSLESEDEGVRAAEVISVFLMQHSRFDYTDLKSKILQQSTNELKLKFSAELLAKTIGYKDPEQIERLSLALEAYCRRFQIVLSYNEKAPVKLEGDVTLIRATEVMVNAKDYPADDDYGLSKIVSGQVNSCLLKGNHESFLDDNIDQIGSLLQDIICPVLD